jgi:hypothetical protein
MPDDLRKRGPADRTRINIHETWELDWWSKEFAVTPQVLKDAVKKVGVMVKDVRKHLGK